MRARRALVFGFIFVVLLLYLGFNRFAVTYINLLWFTHLGFAEIFWRVLTARADTGIVGGLLFGLFVYVNLAVAWPAVRHARVEDVPSPYAGWMRSRRSGRVAVWASAVVAVLSGWALSGQWPTVWFFRDAVPFGTRDPIFGKDVSLYVFRLPFYHLAYTTAGIAFWLTGLAVVGLYFATGWMNFVDGRFSIAPRARAHFSAIVAGYLALKAIGYRLDMWNLMVSSDHGFVSGPGYADIHAALPALHVLVVAAAAACLMAVAAAFGRTRLLLFGTGGLVVISVGMGSLYPALVEGLVVRPSQLQRESPYIADNIAATRSAFDLTKIKLINYPVNQSLTAADLKTFQPTFRNIRLWDWRIAEPAFQQLQGLRPYYTFNVFSIDRYTIQGQYRQVLLGAREINYSALPQQTWVNIHLKFTHGYGAVMLPSSDIGAQGMPVWWLSDINKTSPVGLRLTQPRIYYGSQPVPYAIVGPNSQEFDYPNGSQDVYNHYAGTGGIGIGSLFRRLVFSMWAGDYNALLSSSVGPGSRALIFRGLPDRLPQLLSWPFLLYDSDPYLVDAGGRLYWIADAYTASSDYPYGQPLPNSDYYGGLNYMRNAVKVVVDAYNGTVTYYVADPTDPIIRAEERIFPGVFRPLSAMPQDLRWQIRYPEDYFSAQALMYEQYHMTDPSVFYASEDQWNAATEITGTQAQTTVMPPYYVILQFPGIKAPQFVLMEPFTPIGTGRNNMAAWMAAFSDAPYYGHLVAYEFPKEQTVFGPLQVDSQVNQDPTVAQLLTLWSQGGSVVDRGNLLVIPIKHALLYVEPIYQEAQSTNLPALRRVVVDYGGQQIAVGDTLDQALQQIFGPLPWNAGAPPPKTSKSSSAPSTPGKTASPAVAALVKRAQTAYAQAQADLRAGDFAGYGQEIAALGALLQRMGASPPAATQGTTPTATPAAGTAGAGGAG